MFKKSVVLLSGLLLVSFSLNAKDKTYIPGLGEIMSLTSMRHIKLGLAGQANNWELAEYELHELHEGFDDAIKFHPTHDNIKNVAELINKTMNKPMKELDSAIKAKNAEQFKTHYQALTAACNACHQMTNFGFNVIVEPSSNPFPNQDFSKLQ